MERTKLILKNDYQEYKDVRSPADFCLGCQYQQHILGSHEEQPFLFSLAYLILCYAVQIIRSFIAGGRFAI